MKPPFYNRIDYKGPIENILKKVAQDFKLGVFVSYKLVPFGYEDFNLVLKTNKGKFFVKIFGSFRSRQECKQYVHIMKLAYANGIHYPSLCSWGKKHLYELKIDNIILRLIVQEFIDGKNFIQLGTIPTEQEKKFIIKQAALINKLDFKPTLVYDSWAVVNLENEFKIKGKYLKSYKGEIKQTLKDFKKIPINSLPHCFVHSDMIASNSIRDKDGKIYILDFAVSNYYPRIVELASLICFNFFDPNVPEDLPNVLDFTLKTYQKFIPLEKSEIKALPTFLRASFAIYLIRANYEKSVNGTNTQENKHWLKVSVSGLEAKF